MRSIFLLAFKDIRLQTRDYFGMFWIVVFPLLYALFFGAIFSGQGNPGARAMTIAIIDEEQSEGSKAFVARLEKSTALKVEYKPKEEARQAVLKGKLVAYIVIQGGFGNEGISFEGKAKKLELGIDPSRKAESAILKGIVVEAAFAGIVEMFTDPSKTQELMDKALKNPEWAKGLELGDKLALGRMFEGLQEFLKRRPAKAADGKGQSPFALDVAEVSVSVDASRPRSSFEVSFPQSILWGLMGCIAGFSISIVIERNQGTWLRLRTCPLTWNQVLAGKGLACFFTSVFVIVFLLTLAHLVLGVRLGNVPLLALAVVSTAICFTGLMMLFSTLGKTEAGVAGAGWGIMMPMAMIGGGMVPLIAMPSWMLVASNFSPVKWGIWVLEGAIWRGAEVTEMLLPCAILIAVGAAGYCLGVWKLRRE